MMIGLGTGVKLEISSKAHKSALNIFDKVVTLLKCFNFFFNFYTWMYY